MHFGEYELSPSLIGLSPLPSAHPEAFQRASIPYDSNARLGLAFASVAGLMALNLAIQDNS